MCLQTCDHCTVCPGSHFQETINNSFKNHHTDLAEGSLDARLCTQYNCVKIFNFNAFLGDWDLISILLNSKCLDTRVISSLHVALNIIEYYLTLNSLFK